MHIDGLHQPQAGQQLITHGLSFKAAFAQPFGHGKGGQNPEQNNNYYQLNQSKTGAQRALNKTGGAMRPHQI